MNIIDTKANISYTPAIGGSIKNLPLYKLKSINYELISDNYTNIVFQSAASVEFFKHHHILNEKRIYSMGKSTGLSLLKKGLISKSPDIPGSDGIIKLIENKIGTGRFLVVKGKGGLNEIYNYLKYKNLEVDQVCCYERRQLDSYDNLKDDFFSADAVIFPSTLAVKIFFKEIYSEGFKTKFFGISNRIVTFINDSGYEGILIDYFSNDLEEQIQKFT
jgi:uroporphyrinogen-III synthase